MAPESIMDRGYSVKSDVWSYAITVIEVFTADLPYPELSSMKAGTLVASGKLTHEIPPSVPEPLVSLLPRCFKYDPADRPDFDEITSVLES
jgi:PTK7 protein tyrosine kinase 7